MAVTLYCQACGRGVTIQGIGELPNCRICGPTTWKTASEPSVGYLLSYMDRLFLTSIGIDAD